MIISSGKIRKFLGGEGGGIHVVLQEKPKSLKLPDFFYGTQARQVFFSVPDGNFLCIVYFHVKKNAHVYLCVSSDA